jgi:hypothetical protein
MLNRLKIWLRLTPSEVVFEKIDTVVIKKAAKKVAKKTPVKKLSKKAPAKKVAKKSSGGGKGSASL